MSTTTVYYPRINQINFYNAYGNISGGISGKSIAKSKFWRMVKAGRMPRISLRKQVMITL